MSVRGGPSNSIVSLTLRQGVVMNVNETQEKDEGSPMSLAQWHEKYKSPQGRPQGSEKKSRSTGSQSSPRPQDLMRSSLRLRKAAQPSSRPQEASGATQRGSRSQEASSGEPPEATRPSSRLQEASPGEPPPRRGRSSKNSPQPGASGSSQAKMPPRPRPSDAVPLRPSGLRNMVPSDGVAVVIESRSSGTGIEKKRESASRELWPRKKEKPSMHPSTPSYKVYKCLWKKCSYELHNLENLRKHVRKHREEFDDGHFLCLWGDCGSGTFMEDEENEGLKPLEFGSDAAWERHVKKKHIDPYAWEFGDGPSAHASGI